MHSDSASVLIRWTTTARELLNAPAAFLALAPEGAEPSVIHTAAAASGALRTAMKETARAAAREVVAKMGRREPPQVMQIATAERTFLAARIASPAPGAASFLLLVADSCERRWRASDRAALRSVARAASRDLAEVNVPEAESPGVGDLGLEERREGEPQEAEERFRQLSDNIRDTFWITSLDGQAIYYVSPAFEQIWGYSLADLEQDPTIWMRAIIPQDRRAIQEMFSLEGLQTGEHSVRYRIVRPDGQERWIHHRGFPVRDASGRIYRVAAIAEDITALKHGEEERLHRERYYHSLIQNASDIIAVLDATGHVRFVSPSASHLLGYSRGAMRNMSVLDLIHPGDRRSVEDLMQRILSAPDVLPETIEYRIRHMDGQWRVHEAVGSLLLQEGLRMVIVNARDVTDRKEAERELRESEERFELATRATRDVVWDRDLTTGGVIWNEMLYTTFGYSREQVQPTVAWWQERIHAEDRNRVVEGLRARVEGDGQSWSDEYRFRCADESYATVLDRGYLVRVQGGKPVRMIGAMSNITEYRRLEQQLHLSQRMEAVGRLAGGVAHDFNNLLMVIRGSTDLLLMDLSDDAPSLPDLRQIRKAAERASSLTRQLLAFGRRQILKPEVVDLNEAVAEVHRILNRTLGEDISLVTDLADDLHRAKVDPAQLEQVIINLAVNARDAMPQGGVLTIRTRNVTLRPEETRQFAYRVDPGPYIRMEVMDTGAGMSAEVLSQIFEPFFTTKGRGKGTGLGLSTVYGIIKQSGGYIWAESGEGRGSSFRVLLPSIGEGPLQTPVSRPRVRLPRGTGTILLVEDEDAVRSIARRILARSGYTVWEAASGTEALALCEGREDQIDLLLTDVVMPHMSGRELADSLLARAAGVKVLYMSGHTDDLVVRHGVEQPRRSFIQKPFPPEVLLERVQQALLCEAD